MRSYEYEFNQYMYWLNIWIRLFSCLQMDTLDEFIYIWSNIDDYV